MFEQLEEIYKSPTDTMEFSHLPYIICNEQEQQETLKILARQCSLKVSDRRLHLGFSVWFNLDVICTTKPNFAVVLDIDPAVCQLIYPLLQTTIVQSRSRDEFLSTFIQEVTRIGLFTIDLDNRLKESKKLVYGFLASEDNFLFLQKMLIEKRIFFGRADISAPNIITVKMWMTEKKLELETFYLSNISEWLIQKGTLSWKQFQKNVDALLESETFLIDAFYPTTSKKGSGPPQRITQGSMPSYTVKPVKNVTRYLSTNSTFLREHLGSNKQENTICLSVSSTFFKKRKREMEESKASKNVSLNN